MIATELAQLVAALRGTTPEARRQAAERLSRLGGEAQPAAVALVASCADEDEEVREAAVAALEDLGPPRPEQREALVALAANSNTDAAYWAVTLLGRLGTEAAPAVPSLAAILCGTAELAVRQRAAWALGQMGPAAAAAIVSLQQAAGSDDARLARLAQEAIAQISS